MAEEAITKVHKVMQVVGDQHANELLAKGWTLLDTFKVGVPSNSGESQMIGYVLGWTEKDDPPN